MRKTLKTLSIICLFFITFCSNKNQPMQNGYVNDSYTYDADGSINYNYNIFTASQWNIAPYVQGGYVFQNIPFKNKDNIAKYGDFLTQFSHGWKLGAGITINKNWLFGISFNQNIATTDIDNEYKDYLDEISVENLMTTLDAALRLPFDLFEHKLNFYILAGVDLIMTNIKNKYKEGVTYIPIKLVNDMNKFALGVDLGLSIRYTIVSGLYAGIDAKRLWILTRSSSLIKDTWILSGNIGFQF